jgi:nucleotide-binding universal stress UspA family protein
MRETLEIKLILCPIDFSEFSVSAYRHALSLAEHYQAKLVAQHVVELWRHPAADFVASAGLYEEYSQALSESGKKQLQEFVKNHTHDEIQPELVVQTGVAADSILSFARLQKADVIVMGTHGRRGFDRLMLGSVTDRVMRSAPCPVLAESKPPHDSVAAGKERGHVHHLSRILFCADFSENSDRALKYAISATAEYDAELTLLHVLEGGSSPAKTEEDRAAAAERLDQLIPPEGRKTLKIKTAVRIGKPYAQITQLALETQIDLVTMGVRGRGDLDVSVFGSTTLSGDAVGILPRSCRPFIRRTQVVKSGKVVTKAERTP